MSKQQNDTSIKPKKKKRLFSVWSALIPVAIGIAVVVFLFYHDAEKQDLGKIWDSIDFTARTWGCIFLALVFMFGRDFGMSWRFRALTDRQLPWKHAFECDLLCEFTTCVTPSAVGGSSLGMVFLNTFGIEFGRATTLMLTTLFLDELFFVIACPIVILFTSTSEIFASNGDMFSHGLKFTFWAVYTILFLWTLILFLGIIVKPLWVKSVLVKVFSIKFLRRWQPKMVQLGDNMIATAKELRTKKFRFWVEVFTGTAMTWVSRFLVVNALFFAFIPGADHDQWLILARQFVIWVVLMICPTPGGSGVSEWLFSDYYADLVSSAGMALILAIFWRIITYYMYLLIGAIIVPHWLARSYEKFHSDDNKTD